MAVIIAVWKIFSFALSSFTTMQITNRPSLYQTFWSTFQLNRFGKQQSQYRLSVCNR